MSLSFEYSREHLHSNRALYSNIFFFYQGKKRYCTTKTLLGININNKLKFHVHVGIIGQKANLKLNALAKIRNYMEPPMHFLQYNLIIALQFRCSMTLRTVPEKMRFPAGDGRMQMQSH